MKYKLGVCLLALALSACDSHHDLSECKGPYLALTPPPVAAAQKAQAPRKLSAPVIAPAPASPLVPASQHQQTAVLW